METLGKAKFKVTYNSKDISKDLAPYLISIKYLDHSEGKADELTLSLENVDAYWENEWYPEKGDIIKCEIGYEALMDCGTFEVDEIEISSIPDVVNIKAISAVITGSIRTKKSKAHENTTLKEIVNQVAADNGLTVTGDIADIQFVRITQSRENDLSFLQRLSKQFGYFFSVRGTQLVFTNLFGIISAGSVTDIDREDCLSYTIKDQSAKVVRKTGLNFYNRKTKKVSNYVFAPETKASPDGIPYNTVSGPSFMPTAATSEYNDEGVNLDEPTGDESEEMNDRVENDGQAEVIGKASLLRSNMNQQEGTITIEGNPLLVAGSNFQFTGIGKLAGKYHIASSDHDISKSGYVTTLEVKRVGFIELVKGKRKKTTVKKNYEVKVTT